MLHVLRRSNILAASCMAIILTLSLFYTIFHLIGSDLPSQHASSGLSSAPDGIIFVTHHKTGTAAVGCIVGALSLSMDVQCQHIATPIYVNAMLSSAAIGYYLQITRLAALGRMNDEVPPPFGSSGEVQPPFLLLKTGSGPRETCFDTGSTAAAATLFVEHTSLHSHRPEATSRCIPRDCPCHDGVSNCLSVGSCHVSEPVSPLLWIHFIRRPLDIVLSAYSYHIQSPPPEAWLKQLSIRHYALFLAGQGVDNATLARLGVYAERFQSMSYWTFLRSLSEWKGMLLEFLRSSPQLWSMARHHLRMSRLEGASKGRSLVVRYEELQKDPETSLRGILRAASASSPCMRRQEGQLVAYLRRTCHPGSWTNDQLRNNSHVGRYTTVDGLRRSNLLLALPMVHESISRLNAILGYDD